MSERQPAPSMVVPLTEKARLYADGGEYEPSTLPIIAGVVCPTCGARRGEYHTDVCPRGYLTISAGKGS